MVSLWARVTDNGDFVLVNDRNKLQAQELKGGMGFDKVLAIAASYTEWSKVDTFLFKRIYDVPEKETFKSMLQRGYYVDNNGKDVAVRIDMTLDRYEL